MSWPKSLSLRPMLLWHATNLRTRREWLSENLCKIDRKWLMRKKTQPVQTKHWLILEYLYNYLLYECPTENLFFLSWMVRSKPQGYRADMFNPFRTHLEYPCEICNVKTHLYQKLLKSCCPQDGVLRDPAFARPVFFQCLKVS